MTDAVLEARAISKLYGHVQALSDVNFTVRAGEVVALIGDNGAGKSTLVKILSGTEMPTEGELSSTVSPCTSPTRARPGATASRPSTRTSRWHRTSTRCRTCTSAAR